MNRPNKPNNRLPPPCTEKSAQGLLFIRIRIRLCVDSDKPFYLQIPANSIATPISPISLVLNYDKIFHPVTPVARVRFPDRCRQELFPQTPANIVLSSHTNTIP